MSYLTYILSAQTWNRARRYVVVGPILTMACGWGVDLNDGYTHRCDISYEGYWDTTDMEVLHTDPRYCPIPVRSHEGFDDLIDFAATVTDPGADDAKDYLYLTIINDVTLTVDSETEPFYAYGNDLVSQPTVTYRAATGTLYGGGPDDEADLVIPLNRPAVVNAIGRIFLEVLFGQRSTSMTGPSDIPLSGNCVFTASSTLNGVGRTGMTHRWYLDGALVHTGDTFVPYAETQGSEGMHEIIVRATDPWDYVTEGGNFVHVYPSAPSCP